LLSFIFFLIVRLLPISTLFPYTTLFRSSSPKTAPPITSGEPVLLFFLISKLPRAGLSPWHTPPPNLLWPPLLAGSPRWWRTAALATSLLLGMQHSWLMPLRACWSTTISVDEWAKTGKEKWKEHVLLALSPEKHSTYIIELS